MADKYANQGYVSLTPTLNTLSFAELATFVSIFEKKAFLISRIDYVFSITSVREFDAETDYATFGLCTSDQIADASIAQAAIFDFNRLQTSLQAAGVSSHVIWQPYSRDLSTLPGGGVLVPSRPIFLYLQSGGWAAAGELSARIYFTVVDLKADEYWELVEATRLVGA